jgi:thiamine-monophosphate kinase
MKERELIRRIRERIPSAPGVLVGIGDDAAVFEAHGRLVVTTDLLVEQTHFRSDDPPYDVGWKALAVSLSDIAAMGCRPIGAVLAVALRDEQSDDYALSLIDGVADLATEFGVPLMGGDTTATVGPAVLTSTVFGRAPEGRDVVLRSGARPGQSVLVTGALGGSLAGRHLRFVPRLAEAQELCERFRPGAMIDLSDGLSTDASHIAAESGVHIRLFAGRVPVADAAGPDDPLGHALSDGEDFELLFTLDAEEARRAESAGLAGTAVRIVGEVIAGNPGVTLVGEDGAERPLGAEGYEHFR